MLSPVEASVVTMSETSFPPLDITAQWGRLNDSIVTLVDYVPDDKLDWSPQTDLWNFRGILLHMIVVRDNWLEHTVQDGETTPDVLAMARSKEELQRELARTWERVQRFLSDPKQLNATYVLKRDEKEESYSGHWIAFHLLEHDIHHRADIFHYLALLGIEHPDIGTP